jgi:hypothetical protein
MDHVDRAYRAARVSWRTALRLRWYAKFDRRAGLPVGLSPATTPVLRELSAEYGEVCERERGASLADTDAWTIRLREIEATLRALGETLQSRAQTTELYALPPTEEWLSTRYPGETHLPPSATRERRADAHRRRWNAAHQAQVATRAEMDDLLAERAELQSRVTTREEAARSRVRRYRDLTERKAAIYRRALIRRHPQRDQLIGRWTTEAIPLPAWADVEESLSLPNAGALA